MFIPRRDKREAVLFRLECQSRPMEGPSKTKGPHFDLADIIDACQKAISVGEAATYFDAESREQPGPWQVGFSRLGLEQIDVKHNNGQFRSYVLRFSFANARAADPGRRNLVSNDIDTLDLAADDGLEFGSHMLIGELNTDGNRVNTYPCVLEEMNGLGRSRVINFLQSLAIKFIDPQKRPTWKKLIKKKEHEFVGRPKLVSFPEKSDNMKRLITEGRLTNLEFLKDSHAPSVTDGLPPDLEVEGLILTARVRASRARKDLAVGILDRAARFAKAKGWRMKAVIEKDGGTNNKIIRPYSLEATDLDDQLYARREEIHIVEDLPQCYKTTNQQVVDALQKILDQRNLWI